MAAWDGQGRPEWGHGVNRRERRADGTRLGLFRASNSGVAFPLSIDAFTLYVFASLLPDDGSRSQRVSPPKQRLSLFDRRSFSDIVRRGKRFR